MSSAETTPKGLIARAQGWLEEPRLNGWVLAVIAGLMILRKPWMLTQPQLWAEDGSIFLTFNDLHGPHAFMEPYMGYLLTIPRLIAWSASQLLDPRWWPAFYAWTSWLITTAVVARTFSPRLNLPGKLWLALAFLLGPQTGEVLLTPTNIQWFTGMLFVEQALIAAPRDRLEAATDFVVLTLCGLTGPFVIAFWPLLAWRWLRQRTAYDFVVLLLATACATTQGLLVLRTGPHFQFPPFELSRFIQIVGQHLVTWPLTGTWLAVHLPRALVGGVGVAGTLVLLIAAFRQHPLRRVRLTLVAAFLLIFAAIVYRSRPDSWPFENLAFSERYFFIPRLLLFWLLILEFNGAAAAVRWGTRAVAVVIVLVNLPHYAMRTPTDYHWAEHCDPIRRGVRADIPILPEGWILEYRGRPRSEAGRP